MFNNRDIIITSNNQKKELLKSFNNSLLNIKIYTLNEFNKLYYYDYDKQTILYIMHKYNVIGEIAKIYLDNLTYLTDETYLSTKLQFLQELKTDLLANKLLKVNKLFKASLNNKNILIYNTGLTKEIELLIKELEVSSHVEIINNEELKYSNHQVFEFNDIEDEVEYVANSICTLIKKGIDIKNIYLTNLNDDYYKLIRRIFPMFNIPFTLNDNSNIYGTYLSNKFLELYNSDINKTMEELKSYVDSDNTEDIYNQILDIVNDYAFIDDYNDVLELIKTDLKNTKLKTKDIINSIHESSINDSYKEDDYVYLLSFNQGTIPHIHKDESYLNDGEKAELHISLTVDKNKKEREDTIIKLSNIKNLIITYKKQANGDKYNISNISEELHYEIITNNTKDYTYSNLFNKIELTSLKDEYNKYGTVSDSLYTLNSTYKDLPYKTYNHDFKGINKDDLKSFLNNKLTLSYTKIDNYFKCPFSYYINYILNLNIYEDTFSQKIGTLFHAVLEKFLNYAGTYDELWQESIDSMETTFDSKEQFFLEKLHDELAFVIECLKEQENYTDLHNELHEEKVYTSISGDMKITFSGIVDKIKYKEEDNRTIIAIIDYKTGTPNLDLSTISYGIGMQLPVYLYLAKNSDKLKNIEVAGFYLQHILNNEIAVQNGENYEDLKKKELLLQGYSNDNISILSTFDKTYENSLMIKSMKLKKDGDFYAYAKTLSSENMDTLGKIAENKIKEAVELITNARFAIAPKKIGDINYGCRYCSYRDICYHSPDDIVELEPVSKEDLFGGDL